MSEPDSDWPCEAYGPEGREHGALCFFAEPGERACVSQAECARLMDAERRRLFRRIQERAAAGDPVAEYLAGEFPDPSRILGGSEEGRDG